MVKIFSRIKIRFGVDVVHLYEPPADLPTDMKPSTPIQSRETGEVLLDAIETLGPSV